MIKNTKLHFCVTKYDPNRRKLKKSKNMSPIQRNQKRLEKNTQVKNIKIKIKSETKVKG